MKKIITLSLMAFVFSEARMYSIDEISTMPNTITKDYYIWRFISSHITSRDEAQRAYSMVTFPNKPLTSAIKAKIGHVPKVSNSYPIIKPNNNFTPKEARVLNAKIGKDIPWSGATSNKAQYLDVASGDLSFGSNVLLGINALQFNSPQKAEYFFQIALSKADNQPKIDLSNFWLYKITKDKSYLDKLVASENVNIYTLSARDILGLPYDNIIVPEFDPKAKASIDPYSPVDWENIKLDALANPNDLDAIAEKYRTLETAGIYIFLKEKATNFKISYFPMPFNEYFAPYDKDRQAIMYALARQETRFVPASISPAFALGMMQIMPFLTNHLCKERCEDIDLDEMFKPSVAVSYANQHLDYLYKTLNHPLHIAYAYNGGIGFTRSVRKNEALFRGHGGEYEPYMSMELIKYPETRDYGKKVLANYVVYSNLLGNKVTATELLNRL
jgi:soluble lytic murein transglycosylase